MENFETETVEAEEVKPVKKSHDADKRLQAMRSQGIRDAMDSLLGAVDVDNDDVDEYNVLGGIMVRAGLMWRCVNPSCRGINHNNCGGCDNCGKRRPLPRQEPKPDPFA